MRKIFLIFLAALTATTAATLAYAQTETMTLQTYYPAPMGQYNQMRLAPRGAPLPICAAAADEGSLYYSNADSELKICTDKTGALSWQAIGGGSVWTRNTTVVPQTIYPTDLTSIPNVGIDLINPMERLQITNGAMSILVPNTLVRNYALTVTNLYAGAGAFPVQAATFTSSGAAGQYHYGIYATASNATTNNVAVYGRIGADAVPPVPPNTANIGVLGSVVTGNMPKVGVYGYASQNDANDKYGLFGWAVGGNVNSNKYGAWAQAQGDDALAKYGVYALGSGNAGSKYGVYASATGLGTNTGFQGSAAGGTTNYGVIASGQNGTNNWGLWAVGQGNNGTNNYGVLAQAQGNNAAGIITNYGVRAEVSGTGLAATNLAIYAQAPAYNAAVANWAGFFQGRVSINEPNAAAPFPVLLYVHGPVSVGDNTDGGAAGKDLIAFDMFSDWAMRNYNGGLQLKSITNAKALYLSSPLASPFSFYVDDTANSSQLALLNGANLYVAQGQIRMGPWGVNGRKITKLTQSVYVKTWVTGGGGECAWDRDEWCAAAVCGGFGHYDHATPGGACGTFWCHCFGAVTFDGIP